MTEQFEKTFSEKEARRLLYELGGTDAGSVFGALSSLLGSIAVAPCHCSSARKLGQQALDRLWDLRHAMEETQLALDDPDDRTA
ncbi:hypothetical protein ACFXAF_19375 [Kitasatospora sp. NPDC059463]|uniref:hypothetical protein n=1 Tax=unclassified Kitasatospora TaxID=2633591 RepID=UPI00368D8CC0